MSVAGIVREGLAEADRLGVFQVRTRQLSELQVAELAKATLEFLRSRNSSPSTMPGWTKVSAGAAGVLPWWVGLARVSSEEDRKRLRPLRSEIYDLLEDQGLIVKGPGQGAPVHVSPADDAMPIDGTSTQPSQISITVAGAGYGTPETNRLVERAAMDAVTEKYMADGWEVEDVSAAKVGWDITVRDGDFELHLEVKGVQGPKPSILLTANEYNSAVTDSRWQLVIVTRALVAPQPVHYRRIAVQDACRPHVYRVDIAAD